MENPVLFDRYVDDIPEIAWDLIEITTTPLTIIYPNAKNLAKDLVSEDKCISIRFTREEFTAELLRRFRKPVVSTSANISGEKPPALFDDISASIKQQVDFIVSYRQDDKNEQKPSSIIKLGTGGKIEIIRK